MKHRTGHLFKRGESFYVFWRVGGKAFSRALRDDNGQPITKRREAEEARGKWMAQFTVATEVEALESIVAKLDGRKTELAAWEDQQHPPLPITQAWTAFLASPNRPDSGPETLYQYECQWSAFAEWMKAAHPDLLTLRDVSKSIAEEYAGHLNHGKFSPNTFNKHLGLLTLVFRVVKDKAKLAENPWADIQRKRLATQSRRELTVDELRNVCGSAEGELRTLLGLGIYTGLRLGDCATLRWCEVDLPRGIIRRIPNKTARRNPKPVLVPVHAVLGNMLATSPVEQRGEYVLPEMAANYLRRSDAVTDLVQRHFEKCGIKLHKPGTGEHGKRAVIETGFHSLRHSFVSICRGAGVPLAVVESIVGHSNVAMTQHYSHVGELAAVRAVAMLPSVTGEATPEPKERDAAAMLREEVRAIAESLTGRNWREKKAALLAVLAATV